jgi:hypothetical protein
MSRRPSTFYIHHSRQGAKEGFPWTIHYQGKCLPASWIDCRVPVTTVFKPAKKSNPRAFLKGKGVVRVTSKNNNVRID